MKAAGQTGGSPVSTAELVQELEAGLKRAGRNRLEHPFVLAVESGQARVDQIGGWLQQFMLWADPSNKFLGVMWARCPDEDLRADILENILEEERGTTSNTSGHMRLADRLLEELGWDRLRRADEEAKVETWALRHWLEVVMCNRPFVQAISATSFAMERHNPYIFAKLEAGLRQHYKLSEEALRFISVHASHVEVEHGTLGPTAMSRYATSSVEQDAVRFTVYHTAELYFSQYNVWQYY
jgi:pyrroloquinoline quinone (PQQ) biosynthesis protein C